MEEADNFLELKSTEQQLKEGVERPVDTAYVEDRNGQLILKAVFDVHHFKENEVNVNIEGRKLTVVAQGISDDETNVYRKTLLRTLDLPEQADVTDVQRSISADGILTVEMPLRLPQPQRQPPNPSLVPIINDNGQRKIRLHFMIGPDFTMDDVKVNADGKVLEVVASYEAELGVAGAQVTRRELKKTFILPEYIEVESFVYALRSDGILGVEILLKNDDGPHYRCSVTTEDVTGKVDANGSSSSN